MILSKPRIYCLKFNRKKVEKKDKVKRLRKDREKVLDILFNAFNKHQYYGIKDLVKITQQPAVSESSFH